ncbi:hypothetical protein BDAP_001783 [Binucleata daphniae]
MNLSLIAEQTGNSFLLSSFSALILNALNNRRIDKKVVNAIRNGGNQAKNTFLHNITIKAIETKFNRTPIPVFASFLSGSVFANKKNYKDCVKEGVWSSVNTYLFDKLYNK